MFRVNAKIKKHPLSSRLQRTFRRNAWHVEALEPRVLLSADPLLGALHGVLMPTADAQHALPEAYEPAAAALPTLDAPIDAAALIAAGAHEIGRHGSSTPIVLGTADGTPVRVDGDLVLVSDGPTGSTRQLGELFVSGSMTTFGSGNTTVLSGTKNVGGDDTEVDSIRVQGSARINAGGAIIFSENTADLTHPYVLSGDGPGTLDVLTLQAGSNISFRGTVDIGESGTDTLSGLNILAAQNVTFQKTVTISGDVTINASGTVSFRDQLILKSGANLTITGAASIFVQGNSIVMEGGGNIVFAAEDFDFSGVPGGGIQGTGTVTMRPADPTHNMRVFDASDSSALVLDVTATDLLAFQQGFASFTFGSQSGGHAVAGSGAVSLAYSAGDVLRTSVLVFGSTITVDDSEAPSKLLKLGNGGDLSLDAVGDIDIANMISVADLSLYSASGHIRAIDNNGDVTLGETLRATSLVARAATGIGLPNLQIPTLDVQNTGAGDISLGMDAVNSVFDGNVSVSHLLQSSVGSGNDIALIAHAGTITLAASGQGVSVIGDGTVSLSALGAGSDLLLNAPVSVHGGAVSLNAADAITSTSAGTITSTGASAVSLTSGTGALTLAGAITTVGGSLTLNSGAGLDLTGITLDAGPSGIISLTSIGDLKVGRIAAANAISLTSTTGSILDALVGNAANLFGEAAAVSLSAAAGIGTSAAPLHTAIGTLTASAAGGGIFVAEDSALAIAAGGLSTAGSGAGAIVVVNTTGALEVNGAVHAAAASGHVLLQSLAGELNIHADVVAEHGSISLLAAQALLMNGAAAIEIRSRGVNETLDLRSTTGALTMAADVLLATANAGQRLDAGGAIVLGRIDAGTGSVSLRAGTSITGAVAAPVRNDITAGSLRLMAAGGAIGSSSDALGLQVSRLAAMAGAGAVYLAEADGLTIGGVDGVSANRVAADGTATALAADARLTGLLATATLVLQSAGSGALNLEGAATVLGGGHLLLSCGGALSLDGAVGTVGGGAISLLAAGALTHTAAGTVSTAGGTIDEQAGAALTMAATTQVSSAGARLRLQAGGALSLGQLDAGASDVLLFGSSVAGAAGGSGIDVKAGELRVLASGTAAGDGIGSTADPLSIQVLRLAARAAGGAGIFVAEIDDLGLTPLAAAAGQRVQADGSVIALAADAAIAGLDAGVATLAVSAGGALNVNAGSAVQAGRLRLAAGTDLSIASPVTAGSALSLNAGQDLLLQSNISAAGGQGLALNAGRDLTMTAGLSASAAGPSALAAGGNLRVAQIDVGAAALALSAGGFVRDADADGDSTVNLRAGALLLSAAAGIGAQVNALETSVASLAASGGSGGLFITESDALSVGAVSVSADQLDSSGGLSSAAALTDQGLRTNSASALVLRLLTGNLVLNNAVQAAGGAMRLEAPGTITLAAALSSGGGAISVLAGGAVQQAAVGDVTSNAGSIDLQAGGAWTMADGAEVLSAGGAMRLAAAGLLTVGKLDAGSGAMSLIATALKDIGGEALPADADLTAGRLRIVASGTAGDDGIASSSDALEIAATLLAASAQGGGVFLSQTGALQVDSGAGFAIGRVSIAGGIEPTLLTDAALAGINSAGSLVLRGNGLVQLRAGLTAGNTLLLESSTGSLAIDADVRSATAAVSLSAAVDLLVTAKVSSDGAGRSLELLAGRDVLLQQGSSVVSSNGVIAVQAGAGVLIELIDAGTANVAVIAGTGSIVDGDVAGDTEVDIRAAGLRLSSAGGSIGGSIGASNNALETTVATLTAAAAGVALAETQGLRIDRVAVALQHIGADGVAVALDLGTQEDVVSAGMVLLSVAAGDLQIEGGTASPGLAISAGADLLLRAAAGNLIVNAALNAGGPTSLRASGDALFGVAGDVSLSGAFASLDVEAGASINMGDGTVFSEVNGQMRLAAGLNMSLGALSSGGDVSLAARNITDVGAAEVDVSARGLRVVTLGAGTTQGFGTAAAPIQIQVTTLAADVAGTGAGGLFVREADGLAIASVGPVTVQRVGSDGLRTDVSDAALSDLVSAGNVVIISAAGNVDVNDGSNADGRGLLAGANVLIDVAGDLNVVAALRSAAGNISLLAGGAINADAAIAILRTGRTMDLQAAGALTQGAAGVFATVDSAIRVQAGGDIGVASIVAGRGDVSLISLGGSIVESAGDAAPDVVSAGLRLSAALGIGTAAERLDTAVSILSARAGSGGIWLQEADAVRVGDVAVSVKRVSALATAATDIADATQSDLLTSNNGSIALQTLNGSIVFSDGTAPADGSSVHADGTGTVSLQATGVGATVDLSNQGIAQQGNVVVDSAISLQGPLVISAGLGTAVGDGAITITGAIDGKADGQAGGAAATITLHADGAVHLIGSIGGTQPLAGLVVDGATDVSFDQAVSLVGDLQINATGKVQFLGALHLNSGSLTILGASSLLLGNVVVSSGQGVIHVDALTLAGILSGSSAASLEVAGATANSAVAIGTGAGLSLDTAQLAAIQGFGSVMLGRTDQGATSVDVATLASLVTPNLTLAGRSVSVQGSAASALSAVQLLKLNAAQDLTLAGRLALSSTSADVQANVGGALMMATDGQIVTQSGDVRLQTMGDLVIGRIDSRAGSVANAAAGAVVLASTGGTIREANADSITDVYADLLTLRGRGPLLSAGDSTVPGALDVSARTLDIDALTGIILRDSGADGRTRFNLLDGMLLRQQVVADAATPRQASAAAAPGGVNAAGAPDAWSWLAAAHPLQDSRDISMARMLMSSPVLSSRMAEAPSPWSGLDALFSSEPMLAAVGALAAHRQVTQTDAPANSEAWSEALVL
ncbi:hypothetical protein BH11PSE10_BH11PSE10_04430 [soil metagenome]